MSVGYWDTHVFDIVNTAFDGAPVGFRRLYFQVSSLSDMTTTVRLGTNVSGAYDSVTGADSDYVEAASSSVAYVTVAGVGGYVVVTSSSSRSQALGDEAEPPSPPLRYFVVADFEGTGTMRPSGRLWAEIIVTSGSNSRYDYGPGDHTTSHYQSGYQRVSRGGVGE